MKRILKSILHFIFHDKMYIILNKRRYLKYRRKMLKEANEYNKNQSNIIEYISHKESIRIIFFVYNLGMWKYEGLMKLLLAHPRFEPIIIPYVMPENRNEFNKQNQNDIIEYCKKNKFPIKIGYDFNNNQFIDINIVNPDIIVYTQPYNTGYNNWRIDNFKSKCLFIYTPYGFSVTDDRSLYDTYLTNIAWKIFSAAQMEKEVLLKNISSKKDNVVITGATIYDLLKQASIQNSPWRKNSKKRLIWAPHHSMDSRYSFSSSNFERICFDMIEIASKYQNEIEIAFKPHPILKERLIDKWGKGRTESYYEQWENMPNTIICTGSYIELFAFSDAMIHDCASFVCEYLYTNKPVMYIYKDNIPPASVDNRFGIECFKCHYHGHSIQDIENFIKEVLLKDEDTIKEKRESFIKGQLLPPNNSLTANNMLLELEELFNRK